MRDKQKEAPEGRSGRPRDEAARAGCCQLGGRVRRAQVSGWGGEKGASCHLLKPTPTRPWPAARPQALGSSGSARGQLPGGFPRQFSSAYLRAPASPGSPGPHPLLGAAAREPPPRHPSASLRFPFREFPPRLLRVLLSSPGFPQILTPPHTHSPFLEVPPLDCLLGSFFRFQRVPLLSSPGLLAPSSFPGPLPPLDPAGTVP